MKGYSPQDTLDPCDNFVTGRIRRLVQVYNSRANVRLEIPLERGTSTWNGCEMTSSDEYCILNQLVNHNLGPDRSAANLSYICCSSSKVMAMSLCQ